MNPRTMRSITARLTRRQVLAISGFAVAGGAAASGAVAARADASASASAAGPAGKGAVNVAIVLGEHNTLIDVAGPWEILSSSGYSGGAFNVYSVALSRARPPRGSIRRCSTPSSLDLEHCAKGCFGSSKPYLE